MRSCTGVLSKVAGNIPYFSQCIASKFNWTDMLVQISMLSMEGVYFVGPGLAPNKKMYESK